MFYYMLNYFMLEAVELLDFTTYDSGWQQTPDWYSWHRFSFQLFLPKDELGVLVMWRRSLRRSLMTVDWVFVVLSVMALGGQLWDVILILFCVKKLTLEKENKVKKRKLHLHTLRRKWLCRLPSWVKSRRSPLWQVLVQQSQMPLSAVHHGDDQHNFLSTDKSP